MKKFLRGIWRLFQPFRWYWYRYPIQILPAYGRFLASYVKYKRLGGHLEFSHMAPHLSFSGEDSQSGGGHYFYQDIWALKKLAALQPAVHHDVGSRLDGFVGQATALTKIVFVDIRAPRFQLPNFEFKQGDIMRLPFPDGSLDSLSCLHTIEHIGLGRYGDTINPNGFEQSLKELSRVVRPGGHLLLSMPIGTERVEFNAQRVLNPDTCVHLLADMDLLEFSVVTDQDEYLQGVSPPEYQNARYSCGLYFFRKR